MNLAPTIIPKSDQLNADDLITGPITIKITAANKGSAEQPVSIAYEGDAGRPYKPSKSMRRVLVTLWGKESGAYLGQSLTLYRDPAVKFGGEAIGGIKISHATGITGAVEVMLTVSRGYRKPHTVHPIAAAPEFDATGYPAAWTEWSSEERGDFMATQGLEKLKAWWQSLPKAEKKSMESRLRNDWQPAASA